MSERDKALEAALLPCPFCGGEAEWKSGGPGCAWVSCKTCPAETSDGSIPRIAAAWNRRAALAMTPAQGVDVASWREAIEAAAQVHPSIFHPEDRSGYEEDDQMKDAHAAIQEDALRSYPGANGDVLVALSMLARQQQSIISGAKSRYAELPDKIRALTPPAPEDQP